MLYHYIDNTKPCRCGRADDWPIGDAARSHQADAHPPGDRQTDRPTGPVARPGPKTFIPASRLEDQYLACYTAYAGSGGSGAYCTDLVRKLTVLRIDVKSHSHVIPAVMTAVVELRHRYKGGLFGTE